MDSSAASIIICSSPTEFPVYHCATQPISTVHTSTESPRALLLLLLLQPSEDGHTPGYSRVSRVARLTLSVNVDRLILYSSFFDLTLGPTFLQISLRTHE